MHVMTFLSVCCTNIRTNSTYIVCSILQTGLNWMFCCTMELVC